jgi:UDP-glucose 4-epimerase
MLILHNAKNDGKKPGTAIAAVFGVGLIGAHLVKNLYQHHYTTTHSFPFSWQSPSHRQKEKTDILDCIRNLMKSPDRDDGQRREGFYALPFRAGINPASSNRIDFIWSAGKGGFGMSQDETQAELDVFSEVLEMSMAVCREYPSCLVRFHMISSAGGLFEGQRNVNADSQPAPKRPYAFLKLFQEKILNDCDGLIRMIYRPTSVYGFAGLNRRMGLIPTLLLNGSKNRVSTIFGAPETLRDYVWVDDVGAFIAGMIASNISASGRFFLASGKPSALFEVLSRIEKTLNKTLFCHYVQSGGNAEHNTFSIKTRPFGWKPVDLETGIRKTYYAMFFW